MKMLRAVLDFLAVDNLDNFDFPRKIKKKKKIGKKTRKNF